jgi:two-component system, chemotaxis family, response regulator Rcp1
LVKVQRFSLRSRAETNSGPASEGRARSILLAEDNPGDAGLVRKALEEHGVAGEPLVIADGEKAIEFIQALDADPSAACPGLAIIDLNLPKKPGSEVLERMRLSKKCRHIPVVILSSSDAERDRADAARLGATRYLRKPSRLEEFLSLGAIFKAALSEPEP